MFGTRDKFSTLYMFDHLDIIFIYKFVILEELGDLWILFYLVVMGKKIKSIEKIIKYASSRTYEEGNPMRQHHVWFQGGITCHPVVQDHECAQWEANPWKPDLAGGGAPH